jgi:CheY-like chemotaxis protein
MPATERPTVDTPPRILVCDDDANLRELVRAVLGPGHSFIEAADGNEALLVARELHPDLIVLDLMLPGLSGFDVLKEIRSDPALAEIPVIVITAWSHLESQAWSAGADRFVPKPFDLDRLTRAVEELLP